MGSSLDLLERWMASDESENLEFKEAKRDFSRDKLVRYCFALANERGGRLVLGVSPEKPRHVVGTHAYRNLNSVKSILLQELRLRVDVEEVSHPDGRVLIFHVPSRPVGTPLAYRGTYLMRCGEELVPMTAERLKAIFDEAGPDYSAEVCTGASLEDLSPEAVARFRAMWQRKSGNPGLMDLSDGQVLADAELLLPRGITHAALVLMAKPKALSRHMQQAEVIFEYRASRSSIGFAQRKEYRKGFFLYDEDLWSTINARNEVQHFQEGLFVWDIPTFGEGTVREAVLNAVAHRDYRLGDSVFIRQWPRTMEITSPGGFPAGVTPQNALWKQSWRNRRIAETLAKCGLVERSGQGIDRMFEECIRSSKPLPDFSGSDEHQVALVLRGEVQDPRFLEFLKKVSEETWAHFTTDDLLVLDLVRRDEQVPDGLRDRLHQLVEHGVVEIAGRGRGTHYLLAHRFYAFLGERGVYTRKKGLDRETKKALLMQHLQHNRSTGSKLSELQQVLPSDKRSQIQGLMRELKRENRVRVAGKTKGAKWFPASVEGKHLED